MRVYLIEDNPAKARLLSEAIRSVRPDVDLVQYGSFNTGLNAILESTPDLVVLDMTLPTFDRAPGRREGRGRPRGGYEIMRRLHMRRVAAAVIVVTQFKSFGDGEEKIALPDLVEMCSKEFERLFKGCVYYSAGDPEWRSEFEEIFRKFLEGGEK